MRRSERATTVKKSHESQNKFTLRENNRIRRSLKKSLVSGAIELSSVNREVDTSEKDTSEEERLTVVEDDDYWVDPSAFEFTDTQLISPSTPFPKPPLDTARWSTSVNYFDLEAPVSPTFGSFPSLSPICSPNLSLETIGPINMDEGEFQRKFNDLDNYTVNIKSLIARFNEETVTLLDLGTYRQELKDIFDVFSNFEKKYLDLRGKLIGEGETEVLRRTELKKTFMKGTRNVLLITR